MKVTYLKLSSDPEKILYKCFYEGVPGVWKTYGEFFITQNLKTGEFTFDWKSVEYAKPLIEAFSKAMIPAGLEDVDYCPTCRRGYKLEEEKEMIRDLGECSACDHVRADSYQPF